MLAISFLGLVIFLWWWSMPLFIFVLNEGGDALSWGRRRLVMGVGVGSLESTIVLGVAVGKATHCDSQRHCRLSATSSSAIMKTLKLS